jgi:hypothetical protein
MQYFDGPFKAFVGRGASKYRNGSHGTIGPHLKQSEYWLATSPDLNITVTETLKHVRLGTMGSDCSMGIRFGISTQGYVPRLYPTLSLPFMLLFRYNTLNVKKTIGFRLHRSGQVFRRTGGLRWVTCIRRQLFSPLQSAEVWANTPINLNRNNFHIPS